MGSVVAEETAFAGFAHATVKRKIKYLKKNKNLGGFSFFFFFYELHAIYDLWYSTLLNMFLLSKNY